MIEHISIHQIQRRGRQTYTVAHTSGFDGTSVLTTLIPGQPLAS